jgi:hypothetical protein
MTVSPAGGFRATAGSTGQRDVSQEFMQVAGVLGCETEAKKGRGRTAVGSTHVQFVSAV